MRSPRNLDDAQTRQRRGPGALGRGGRVPIVRAPARAVGVRAPPVRAGPRRHHPAQAAPRPLPRLPHHPCATSRVLPAPACGHRAGRGRGAAGQVRGASHRRIAANLGLPADTVRGWIRRATANASWLSECGTIMAVRLDSMCAPILPTGTPLGDALEALGSAAAAATRRLGPDVPPWERIAYFTNWRLLSPVARAG